MFKFSKNLGPIFFKKNRCLWEEILESLNLTWNIRQYVPGKVTVGWDPIDE